MSRDIQLLHPELQGIVYKFLAECTKQGLTVSITETFRTKTEQDNLYAKGRTSSGSIVTKVRYPYSTHCWGVAFDFCRNVKGREYDDSDGFFKKVGQIGKSLGLVWGGDWKDFVDKPHFELRKYTTNSLISSYGVPINFQKTWNKETIIQSVPNAKKEDDDKVVYKTYNDIPDWGKPAIKNLLDKKYLTGIDSKGTINVTESMLRVFVVNYKAGLYK